MSPWRRCVLIGVVVLAATSAPALQACQERVLTLRFSPPTGHANNWCWAASGQMIMELLGEQPKQGLPVPSGGAGAGREGLLRHAQLLRSRRRSSGSLRQAPLARLRREARAVQLRVRDHLRRAARTARTTKRARRTPLGWTDAHGRDLRGPAGDRILALPRLGAAVTRSSSRDSRLGPIAGSWSWIRRGSARRTGTAKASSTRASGSPTTNTLAGWDGMVHWVDFYGIKKK